MNIFYYKGRCVVIISKNITLKALFITIADDIFFNNFLTFGYNKT